jgi:3-ketoacyl-CoA synthase
MINWTHVLGIYILVIFVVGLSVPLAQIVHQVVNDLSSSIGHQANLFDILNTLKDLFLKIFKQSLRLSHDETLLPAHVKIKALVLAAMGALSCVDNPVYLLSFATFHAPDSWKVSHEQIIEMMRRQNAYTDESLEFMRSFLVRSGTGQSTAWPPGIVQCLEGKETDKTIEGSRKEAEYVIFDIVEKALKKAKVHPKEIDVLVINCSLFSPTPSLCAMVVSKFGMRSDVLTYNLSGMGCGASLISVDLAKDMLRRHRGKALVVSTEIITPNLYYGNEHGFLLQNAIFRCGGAAIVLSNKRSDRRRAWYKLLHTVRVQGTDEKDYKCIYETQDEEGFRGVRLSKDIVKVAGKCLQKNMTTIGPYVLPLSEQIKVVYSLMVRFFFKTLRKTLTSTGKEKWGVSCLMLCAHLMKSRF